MTMRAFFRQPAVSALVHVISLLLTCFSISLLWAFDLGSALIHTRFLLHSILLGMRFRFGSAMTFRFCTLLSFATVSTILLCSTISFAMRCPISWLEARASYNGKLCCLLCIASANHIFIQCKAEHLVRFHHCFGDNLGGFLWL